MKRAAVILIGMICLLYLTSCKFYDVTNETYAKIYPNDGYADVATVISSKPIKLGKITRQPIAKLSGWVCEPEAQFAKQRRAYDSEKK